MKVLGICGSPKKNNSTTLYALKKALESVSQNGVETDFINLGNYSFSGCIDCGGCRKEIRCTIDDDYTSKIMPKLNDSSIKGIIFASPVYFGGITAQMKAFIDRSVIFRRNGFAFSNIVAGVLTVGRSRNGGQELAAMDLVKNCLIQDMIVVSDAMPTSHFGGITWSGHPDGIENDVEGINTAINMGRKVAQVVKKMYGSK